MFNDEVRSKLENIIQGTVIQEQPDSCATIRNQLCASFATSTTVKKDFESKRLIKEEQVRFLQELANTQKLWISKRLTDGSMTTQRAATDGSTTVN